MSVYPEDPPSLAWGMWKRFLAAAATIVFLTATGSATAVLLEVELVAAPVERVDGAVELEQQRGRRARARQEDDREHRREEALPHPPRQAGWLFRGHFAFLGTEASEAASASI